MIKVPKVSIITVNLNNAGGLKQTLNSVVNQNFSNYEYIIIDGASTDKSSDIINESLDHITIYICEPDTGIYEAMNKGIKKAKGEYCLFLNSGDWLINDNVLTNCFSKNQVADILIGGCNVSREGTIIHTYKSTSEISLLSFYKTTIPHQSTFIKRELFKKLGLYNELYKIHADYEFWIRSIIQHNCSVNVIDVIVSDYNIDGISSKVTNNSLSEAEVQNILNNNMSDKILVDYSNWHRKKSEYEVYEWIESKKVMRNTLLFIYKTYIKLSKIKKSIKK